MQTQQNTGMTGCILRQGRRQAGRLSAAAVGPMVPVLARSMRACTTHRRVCTRASASAAAGVHLEVEI